MHLTNILLIVLLGTVGFLVAVASLTYAAWVFWWRKALSNWFAYWTEEGKNVATIPGYVTPPVSRTARTVRAMLARIAVPLVVGPIKVVGRKNLKSFKGRLVWSSNHILYFDALVFAFFFFLKNFRFMIKIDQVRGPQAFGLAWIGAIPVAVPGSSAWDLVQAIFGSVEAEEQEESLEVIVCPEGGLQVDGVLVRKKWQSGVFRHATLAQIATGVPHAVVPIYLDYDYNPQHESLVQSLVRKSGLMRKMHQLALTKGKVEQRQFGGKAIYGATVYIGRPIPVDELPKRPRAAMDVIFQATVELETQAKAGRL